MTKDKFDAVPIRSSEITPEYVYLNRRQFLKSMGVAGAGALLLAACSGLPGASGPRGTAPAPGTVSAAADETGAPLTPYDTIMNYNNYYEFSTDKEAVAGLVGRFKTSPWTLEVGGMVRNPKKYAIEDLLKKFEQQERIYRLRCVEAWSMVIPWSGFQLSELLKEAEPLGEAKYVRFESVLAPDQMPGQQDPTYPWPYNEGLRLDEAMHRLTLLATGLYGKPLPAQDGAPIRVVVPWKYGFKSIKSIVKLEVTDKQPATLWSTIAPNEYGFYANVNPDVDHPRWSQKSERRIGENDRRRTLKFNGYEGEVAALYAGMDLSKDY